MENRIFKAQNIVEKLSGNTFYKQLSYLIYKYMIYRQFVNEEIVELFELFFKFEDKRITMKQLKDCKWLNY